MQLTWICLMSLKVQTIWANLSQERWKISNGLTDSCELYEANVQQKLKTSIENIHFSQLPRWELVVFDSVQVSAVDLYWWAAFKRRFLL